MKIWATSTYENSFEMEVPDDATDEEIHELIADEDEYLCGDWSSSWRKLDWWETEDCEGEEEGFIPS